MCCGSGHQTQVGLLGLVRPVGHVGAVGLVDLVSLIGNTSDKESLLKTVYSRIKLDQQHLIEKGSQDLCAHLYSLGSTTSQVRNMIRLKLSCGASFGSLPCT